RGAGGCRHQHAIAAERRYRPSVNFDYRPQHAQPRSLLEARLVQRPPAVGDLAVGAHHDVERHAFLDTVVPLDDVIGLGLGEEADAAEIDTQHGYFDVTGELGGAQKRPVAAEDEDQFAAFGG